MKKYLFLLLGIVLFASCDDDKDDAYYFEQLVYSLQSGDGQTSTRIQLPPKYATNMSPLTKEYAFYPADRIVETSSFGVSNADLGLLAANRPMWVYVPIGVANNRIELGNVEWEFTHEPIEWADEEQTTITFTVGPYQEVEVIEEGILDEITVSYTAYFVNPDTNHEREVRGKWKGSYYVRTDIRFETTSLLEDAVE